jgi:hypothetical protein
MSFLEIVERGRAYEVFKERETTKNVLPGQLMYSTTIIYGKNG